MEPTLPAAVFVCEVSRDSFARQARSSFASRNKRNFRLLLCGLGFRGLVLDAADPDIYGVEARIDPAEANALLAGFTALSLPMFLPSARFGLDGVRYGIAFGDGWCGTEVAWWSEPDEAWRPLVEAYERTIARLEARLPASTLRAKA
ncbi:MULTISPECIES: hypothetical protein [Lysobacter]|uniref:hypothetical protein n=1 Tax=Lysobacter TaxID=68 RepID=UPI00126A710F|nr:MULTISPECIES: hypothetical protein [Lysobacter]